MLIPQQRIAPRIFDLLPSFVSEKKAFFSLGPYLPKNRLYHRWTGSGREALRQILSHLRVEKEEKQDLPGRLDVRRLNVGVPAYTCHVVLDAVKKAGCNPIFYDSGVVVDIVDIRKIIKNVDVLILSYNFGFLPEIDSIAAMCKKNNVILVEDCAQALGARYKNRLAGSFGDYAFYSFGISKNIGFNGGLIVSKKNITFQNNRPYHFSLLLKNYLEVIVYPLFFNRFVYPLSSKLLKYELSKNHPTLSYKISKLSLSIIHRQALRYAEIISQRKKNSIYCMKALSNHINFVKPSYSTDPSWLYFVIITPNSIQFKNKLIKNGVDVNQMFTFQCFDEQQKKALKTEKEVLTFALYRNLKEIKYITNQIKKTSNEIKL